jgi:hypothetical protein
MSSRSRWWLLVFAAFCLSACSSTVTGRKLAQDAVTAMGGVEKLQAVKTLSMKGGSGTRFRLGQMVKATDQENAGQLKDVVDIVDLANGRASLDYALQLGGFMHAPSAKALFQPDLYTPPAAANGGPSAQHLLQAIKDLNLKVDTMVGGHGGIGTFADFVKAATPPATSN